MGLRILPRSLKTAVDLLEADPARSWTVDELALACGISRRTLQRHFRCFIGQTPMAFRRSLSLERARRDLLRAADGSSIADIAMRHGFNHLGRFASLYRERYEETPSATLTRSRNDFVFTPGPIRLSTGAVERPTIAVLSFDQIGGEASSWMALSEEIAASLVRPRWLAVHVPEKARYHLGGLIRSTNDGWISITATLLDSSSGRYFWAGRWRCDRNRFFEFIEKISEQIVLPITQSLLGAEIERVEHHDEEGMRPWDLMMRALPHLLLVDPIGAERALELLEQAIERAPNDALPLAMAAWCHGLRGAHNFSSHPDSEKAASRTYTGRAAKLNAGDALTDTMLSASYCLANDLEKAARHADRALALDVSSAWAWGRSGWTKAYDGESAEAIELFQIARSLAPTDSLKFLCSVGIAAGHFWDGSYEKSAGWFGRALAENPAAVWINQYLTPAYALSGRKQQAAKCFKELNRDFPNINIAQVRSGLPYGPGFLDRVAEGLESTGMRLD